MNLTSRNKAVLGLAGLLVIIACAPFGNLVSPTNTPSVIEAQPVETEAPLGQPTATAAPASVPTATATTIVRQPVLPTPTPAPSELYAFIQAPEGPLSQPFVTLFGFQDVPDATIQIVGAVNSNDFICRGSPCAVPIQTSSIIVFRALSSEGNTSDEVSATVRVESTTEGYYVFLDTVSQFSTFTDSCLRFWRFEDFTDPVWAEFVQFPYQLNTNKTLHYLVTQLIIHGFVDVSGCPAGGLSIGLDWPTGCGLERARNVMIEWQNQYDEYIWLASRNIGIPPKLLKTLIEVESQFWPGNQRFYVDEVGLGQLNQLGVDVLLRRNPGLYQEVCAAVLDDCTMPYTLLPAENQAMIRGAFINSQNAICPDCEGGLDLNVAKRSISFVAQVLKANCETVKVITDANRPTGYIDALEDPYSDFWKFTLLSYHSGISCFERAVKATPKGDPLDWESLSTNIDCAGGFDYVDGLWGTLLSFDLYRYTPSIQEIGPVVPEFLPTRTPPPSPIPVISSAVVEVEAFLDSNQNGIMEDSERLNNITVLLQSVAGTEVEGTIENGQAVLELRDFPIGTEVTVSLPAYFRTETIIVPADGVVTVRFIFTQPTLPTAIP